MYVCMCIYKYIYIYIYIGPAIGMQEQSVKKEMRSMTVEMAMWCCWCRFGFCFTAKVCISLVIAQQDTNVDVLSSYSGLAYKKTRLFHSYNC